MVSTNRQCGGPFTRELLDECGFVLVDALDQAHYVAGAALDVVLVSGSAVPSTSQSTMAIHVALPAQLVALLTSLTISCATSLCRYSAGTSLTEAHQAPAFQLSKTGRRC